MTTAIYFSISDHKALPVSGKRQPEEVGNTHQHDRYETLYVEGERHKESTLRDIFGHFDSIDPSLYPGVTSVDHSCTDAKHNQCKYSALTA